MFFKNSSSAAKKIKLLLFLMLFLANKSVSTYAAISINHYAESEAPQTYYSKASTKNVSQNSMKKIVGSGKGDRTQSLKTTAPLISPIIPTKLVPVIVKEVSPLPIVSPGEEKKVVSLPATPPSIVTPVVPVQNESQSYPTSVRPQIQPLNLKKVALAPLCPNSVPVMQAIGIGDGCSTSYDGFNLALIPEIGIFKGTFTSACNNHDRCYTTLGYSTAECNSNSLSDMKSACSSKYNKFFRPVEYLECNRTAAEYKAAVDIFMRVANPGLGFQKALVTLNNKLFDNDASGICYSSPERSHLYAPEVIEQVNKTFTSYAGRLPTNSEFFTSVANYYSVSDYSLNKEGLIAYAKSRSYLKFPSVTFTRQGNILKVKNPIESATYIWEINGYPEIMGSSMEIPVDTDPMYDAEYPLTGYVSVVQNGLENRDVIDTVLRISGECGSKSDKPCILR